MQQCTIRHSMDIALVCEGNAESSETAFSGTAKKIYQCLKAEGNHLIPVDASLHSLQQAFVACSSFSKDKLRWRSKYRYGSHGAKSRTAASASSLGTRKVDIILQIGATYDPPHMDRIPYALYCDWNLALNIEDSQRTHAANLGLTHGELQAINAEHTRRYSRAQIIFTISERLRHSFIDLYKLPPSRVRTAYAGPNFDTALIDQTLTQPKQSQYPTILFIAKEFRRKGSDIVASAFSQLLQAFPEVHLVFAGAEHLPDDFLSLPNVEHLGILDKAVPSQLQRLLSAFRQADVLVLPSRYDPFPTVIREAMFFGIPCVASNIWAMPEMIEDGKTGFLIPPNDSGALFLALKCLLNNIQLRLQMGQSARARAEALFSWSAVGKVLTQGLEDCVASDVRS